IQGGLNMSEATTLSSATQGILCSMPSDLPYNEGVFRRIKVKMGKNQVVGYSEHPASMSMATTNVTDHLSNCSATILEGIGKEWGIAESGYGRVYAHAVISGNDPRTGKSYVNQVFNGSSGGGAL